MSDQQPQESTPQTTLIKSLGWALKERAEVKTAELLLEVRKTRANTAIIFAMANLRIDKYIGPEGALTLKAGGMSTTLDKEKMITGFLRLGLPELGAEVIKRIVDAATTETPKRGSIDFRAREE
jgi:hypothetical protein